MEGKGLKKKSYFSMNTIMKVYLPIVLTIFVVFNIPFIPNPIGLNTNLNFQPAAASGESYFFDEAYFKKPNKNKKTNSNNHNGDLNIAIWITFLIICIIFGFIYFIFYGVKNDNEQEKQNSQDKMDYIELLKDDSDFEGNI